MQNIEYGTFTDPRDGKTYKTVKIGDHWWMAENLNYEIDGSRCYNNDPVNGEKYGRLYSWKMAMEACPKGWYLPSKVQWDILFNFINNNSNDDYYADYGNMAMVGKHLKATSGWPNHGECRDAYGFSALPGGRGSLPGILPSHFNNIYGSCNWWTSDEKDSIFALKVSIHDISPCAEYSILDKHCELLSVRCVKYWEDDDWAKYSQKSLDAFNKYLNNDLVKMLASVEYEEPEVIVEQNPVTNTISDEAYKIIKMENIKKRIKSVEHSSFTDPRDGKTYKTVKIGEQTWFAENLNYEAEGSKCYDNDPANGEKYGRLYYWKTAKKVCPKGWHLPTEAEWKTLLRYVDGASNAESPYDSKTVGRYLKAKDGLWGDWENHEFGYDYMDDYGFTALPGGHGFRDRNSFRNISHSFGNIDYDGSWWTASLWREYYACAMWIGYDDYGCEHAGFTTYNKSDLCSIRCIMD